MSELGQRPRIAILGWGPLIWDKRPEFDEKHAPWKMMARHLNWNSRVFPIPEKGLCPW
ncbi:hypothetical protein MES5069_490044 [Mesorhizobium escarrei]|uniref:DUF72 domain-containing protein n=1 Tax=Mesorhizobium escarrei TaxID=666018 RepID=A0ABN8K8K6_9HYPH|nr:hypothetical protein MES5069_490044 [Mesorhizobium escarrei]